MIIIKYWNTYYEMFVVHSRGMQESLIRRWFWNRESCTVFKRIKNVFRPKWGLWEGGGEGKGNEMAFTIQKVHVSICFSGGDIF